jgi:hypothetical protein
VIDGQLLAGAAIPALITITLEYAKAHNWPDFMALARVLSLWHWLYEFTDFILKNVLQVSTQTITPCTETVFNRVAYSPANAPLIEPSGSCLKIVHCATAWAA